MSATTFASKKDAWLVSILGGAAVLDVLGAVVSFFLGKETPAVRYGVSILLLFSAAVIVWCLAGTTYRIAERELLIRCGPFRSRVAIGSIRSVAATHSALAAPALSTDRLALTCSDRGAAVQVSPRDTEGFIAALRAVNPGISVGSIAPHPDTPATPQTNRPGVP